MKKTINYVKGNILFLITLALLAFIPLYPKLPIIGVNHTWVYIRLEDFLVALALLIWGVFVLRKKASYKTPLTIPMLIFWGVGLVSTVFAVIFIFPTLANVFPSIAALNYLRQIEYLSVFFVAYSSIKGKKSAAVVTAVLTVTLLAIVAYGFGQRGILVGETHKFPAFLTMNEEFAKGVPLILSDADRIASTFAGHYDLAAYLILVIPILASMIFGFKNIFSKIALLLSCFSGLILLLMTASRVSFVVYLCAVTFMLILQKKKLFIIPFLILSIFVLQFSKATTARFGSTLSQVDVVVDARTGKAIGIAQQVTVPATAKKAATKKIVIEDQQSTGENLPQGSSYINLPAQTAPKQTLTEITYKKTQIKAGTTSAEVTNIQGDFAIKKVLAYDVSFTTRFQGEWPRAMDAFKRNILLGTGYSSITLASDNNYLRMLGETGALGFFAYILLFIIIAIYAYRVLPDVDSKASKSLVIGILAGLFGLSLNAILIDVFEASKVAFSMWLLIGVAMGTLHMYQKKKINYVADVKKVLTSVPAIFAYLLTAIFSIFAISINNYFVADDFTWLRWAADCTKVAAIDGTMQCQSVKTTFINYFLHADGFFYRPGMKLYFYAMYSVFWINQGPYHVVSLLLHFVAVAAVFLITTKILKSKFFGLVAAICFLVLGVHSETIFWISSVGHLFAADCSLIGLLLFMYWKEKKHVLLLIASLVFVASAPLFQEIGIVAPLLVIGYDVVLAQWKKGMRLSQKWYYALYLLPIPLYLGLRFIAKSHWGGGDYSFKLSSLPFNAVGNSIGYFVLTLLGSPFMQPYQALRDYGRTHIAIAFGASLVVLLLCVGIFMLLRKYWKNDVKNILLSLVIFIVALLPVLGLGNIAFRYAYLASFGVVLFVTILLQKLYIVLKKAHMIVGVGVIVVIVGIISWYNIMLLFTANSDWQQAGNITDKLLINFNDVFAKDTTPNPVFYFVNTPTKYGEAWVFPVGLPDALWFTFQNSNLNVQTTPTLNMALDYAEGSTSAKVFEFEPSGTVEQIIRTKTIKDAK